MKTLFAFCCLLFVLCARGAVPTFQSFEPTQFLTNNNRVAMALARNMLPALTAKNSGYCKQTDIESFCQFSFRTMFSKSNNFNDTAFVNLGVAGTDGIVSRQIRSGVFPQLASKNIGYFGTINIKHPAQLFLADGFPNLEDFYHVRLLKLSECFPFGSTILPCHVCHVVLMGAEKKMVGANAWRIIAIVKNPKAIWNRAVMDHPRHPRCLCWCAPVTPNTDFSIPTTFRTSPKPTVFSFLNPAPKTIENRFRKSLGNQIIEGIVGLHTSLSLLVCRALGFPDRKGISFFTP